MSFGGWPSSCICSVQHNNQSKSLTQLKTNHTTWHTEQHTFTTSHSHWHNFTTSRSHWQFYKQSKPLTQFYNQIKPVTQFTNTILQPNKATDIILQPIKATDTILLWASALCIRFTVIPPRLSDPCNFITVLLVTREPEQTTLLFWSAACCVTPHGLHTADRR